ncbi:hypothetical protein OUZ56_028338 [Daphnia magna]|uniref:Uncharacterized protein n=1 Tax=Daphnia magna TaxID=35525 RepID=A0ABR0B3J7_9CRUS|nr:hypothetical protein OUZ56_028338 [Daphnia magna]
MWYADAKSFFVCEKEMVARGSADGLVRIVGGASQIERPVVDGSRTALSSRPVECFNRVLSSTNVLVL